MLDVIQQRKTGVKILMGVILGIICLTMVITLVPGLVPGAMTGTNSADSVARVGDEQITKTDVDNMLNRELRGQTLPPMLKGMYAKQVVDQLIFQKALELEANRLGLRVTPEEQTDRIKKYLPTAFTGDTWVGKERYQQEVESRTGMSVADFEEFVRQQLLEEKFRNILTDGVTVSDTEIAQEYIRRNEKISFEYAVFKPADLAATINPTDAELLDLNQLKQQTKLSDEELRAAYQQGIDQFKVQNRVHVEHILFKTVGKTDAEVAEIQKTADGVLKKAKSGGNFEDLAKQYSEDTSKTKGGDIGWIIEGQTVPEFQQAAFSLPKGSISDLVKTQYGFHIIKVLDKETARTKSFEEVKAEIEPAVLDAKVNDEANKISDQMAAAVRQSNRQSLDDLAKKFNLTLGSTPPAAASEALGDLGNSPDVHQTLNSLRPGEVSAPLRIDRGWVIISVKDVQAAHQGTLAETRDQVLADYRRDNSTTLARSKAEDLAKRVKGGEALAKAAKELGAETKTTAPFARNGQVSDLGSAAQFNSAFNMAPGQVSDADPVAANWVVYRIVTHDNPKMEELLLQKPQLEQQLLQTKQQASYEAFKTALQKKLTSEGKIVIDAANMKAMTGNS
jgi:peptidyl-prolyl cis-trans isomerase D